MFSIRSIFRTSLEHLYPFFKTWGSGGRIFFTAMQSSPWIQGRLFAKKARQMKSTRWLGALVGVSLTWGVVAWAAEIQVTTTVDVVAKDGKCSIREAAWGTQISK
jgi:hypothetical protein